MSLNVRMYRRPKRSAKQYAQEIEHDNRMGLVFRGINNTLENYVPLALWDSVATNLNDLGIEYNDVLWINRRNFQNRVKVGTEVYVTFGHMTHPSEAVLVGIGKVVTIRGTEKNKYRDCELDVDFDGFIHTIHCYQVIGIIGRD